MSIWTFSLEPVRKWSVRELFPVSHPVRTLNHISNENAASSALDETWLHPVYGIDPVDSGDPFEDGNRFGKPTYVEADFSSPEAQEYLLGVCDRLLGNAKLMKLGGDWSCPLYAVRREVLNRGIDFPIQHPDLFYEVAHEQERYPERRTVLTVMARAHGAAHAPSMHGQLVHLAFRAASCT